MSLRETLNRNPALAGGVAVAAVVLLGIVVWRRVIIRPPDKNPVAQNYFTVDDGKTFFTDDAKLVPPFTKDGQEAVRAFVYQTQGGSPEVVYLMKYTPEAKQALESATTEKDRGTALMKFAGGVGATLVKKPLEGDWVDGVSDQGRAVKKVPDGAKVVVPPSKAS